MQIPILNSKWFLVSILGTAIGLSVPSYANSSPLLKPQESDQSETADAQDEESEKKEDETKDDKKDDNKDDEKTSKKKPKKPPVPGTSIGEKINDIIGEDVEGEEFSLSDYEGKVIMLDFWGDW